MDLGEADGVAVAVVRDEVGAVIGAGRGRRGEGHLDDGPGLVGGERSGDRRATRDLDLADDPVALVGEVGGGHVGVLPAAVSTKRMRWPSPS